MEQQPALLVADVDGTLVRTRSGSVHRQTPDDWEWIPGRLEAMREAHRAGVRIAIATNQGMVAFGRFTAADMTREIQRVADDIGPGVDVHIAFGMRHGTVAGFNEVDPMRKPRPGMILAAMRNAGVPRHRTLMLGDRADDREAALRAGCHFAWAQDYFAGHQRPGREIA